MKINLLRGKANSKKTFKAKKTLAVRPVVLSPGHTLESTRNFLDIWMSSPNDICLLKDLGMDMS